MSAAEPAARAPEPPSDRLLRRLPSPAVLVVIVFAAILVMTVTFHGLTDVDYFWHVTTGRLIATTGAVPTTDPFSFTYAGGPWTPHEWLGELLIYELVARLGGSATLAIFGLVGGASIAVGIAVARRRGIRVPAITGAAVLTAGVLVSYLTVRPQALSWLLLAVLIGLLGGLRAERPRQALWLIPLFVLWANLHGLYVVGLGVVLVWAVATLFGRTRMAAARGWAAVGTLGAVAASMVTPAGPVGILYPLRYVQPGAWGLSHIQEWLSPNFHDPASLGLLLLIAVLLLVGWRGAGGAPGAAAALGSPGWLGVTVIVLVVISLVSLRNAPMAAVAAFPVIALSLDGLLPVRVRRAPTRSVARVRRFMEMGLALVIIGAAVVIFTPRIASNEEAALREHLPVAGVNALLNLNPRARVFAEYGWGGYVIYRMYDAGSRVFVDGRNDMYPERILDDYSSIRDARALWSSKLDAYGSDAILLPPGAGLASALAGGNGTWCESYRDNVQVLFTRCNGA
jgi:hypothetical protein